MEIVKLPIATIADGTCTIVSDQKIFGQVHAVVLEDGDLADGVDIVLTCETPTLSIPILTKADFNTDRIAYPRALEHLVGDGSDLATHTRPLAAGKFKAVIAQGGDTKVGSVTIYVI